MQVRHTRWRMLSPLLSPAILVLSLTGCGHQSANASGPSIAWDPAAASKVRKTIKEGLRYHSRDKRCARTKRISQRGRRGLSKVSAVIRSMRYPLNLGSVLSGYSVIDGHHPQS